MHLPPFTIRRLITLVFAGLLVDGSLCGGAAPVLVSHDASGNPGGADSGLAMALTPSQGRYVQSLDSGVVLFLSQAPLEPVRDAVVKDNNQVHDFYAYGADGSVRVLSLPGAGNEPCMWGQTDASGSKGFVLRQTSAPSLWMFQYGPLSTLPVLTPLPFSVQDSVLKMDRIDFAGNGQVVAYAADVAGRKHIEVRDLSDLAGGSPSKITQTANANGDSSYPVISSDGTRVAFISAAYNLVAGDTNGVDDIFLSDQSANPATITLVSQRFGSVGGYWPTQTPAISGDGQVVAFVSQDANFVVNDANGKADVFVAVSPFDANQRPTRVSVSATGTPADQDALDPKLSQTGRFVVFRSKATTLVSGAAGSAAQVYLVDRDLGTIECVSRTAANADADADCLAPNVSPSGRYVTFVSAATNLAANVPAGKWQVYRVDRGPNWANHPPVASALSFSMLRGQPVTFSLTATDADGNALTYTPTGLPLIADGILKDTGGNTIVVNQAYQTSTFPWTFTPKDASVTTASFQFQASDGIANSAVAEVSFLDGGQGTVERVSVSTAGAQGAGDSGYSIAQGVGITGSGSGVLFSSVSKLDSADVDSQPDVYFRDCAQAKTEFLSKARTNKIGANDGCARSAISGNGVFAVFLARSSDFYVVNRGTDALSGGPVTPTQYPGGPVVSTDGSRIVYSDGNTVVVMGASANIIESAAAEAPCSAPAISADGQVTAFASTATDLVPGGNPSGASCIFWKRIGTSGSFIVSQDNSRAVLADAATPVLSTTGRFVAFLATGGDSQAHLYRRNVGTGEVLDLGTGASNPAISADGRFLYFVRNSQAYRYDTAAPAATQPVLVSHAPAGAAGDGSCGAGALSATGQYVAFASSSTNLVSGDTNGKWDVFRADLGTPANTLPTPSLHNVAVDEDQALTGVAIGYTDAEGNDAEFRLLSQPQHAKANSFAVHDLKPGQTFPTFDYQPADHYYGTDTFSYQYGDVGGWSDPVSVTITVNEINDPPVLAAVANQAVVEGQALDVALTASDPDTANPDAEHRETLSLSVTSGPGAIQNGHWVYTPDYTVASKATSPLVQSVTVQVADGRGLTAQQTFSVTVTHLSHPPVIQINGPLVLAGNASTGAITTSLVQVTDLDYANATPPPANLQLTLLTAPTRGNLTDKNNQILGAGNTFSYGDFPLTFTCTDAPTFGVDSAAFKVADLVEDSAGQESLPKTLNIVIGAQVQSLSLEKGWNLVSFCLTPAFTDPAVFLAVNGQSVLDGPVWRWDAAGRQFLQVQQAKAGEGYWVKSTQTVTLPNLPGHPAASGLIPVVAGWNLVGPVGSGLSVPCPLNCYAWGWLPQSSAFATSPANPLRQGQGYWLHVPDGTTGVDLSLAP